jgi:predicted Fe-Mo cluster-binding NifX family protein
MKIAVTSQNRREITKEASFHDSSPHAAHPLDGVDMLIAGGMGSGLQARLARKGIEAVVTPEKDPDRAVSLWLTHSLARAEPHAHAHGADHGLDHDHEGGRSCGSGCDCA